LPTAVISGRIMDEDGDPMSEVRVIVQKKKPGKASRETAATVGTNDLGEYRVAGLFPGQYWILAIPPPDIRDYEQQREKSPQPDNPAEPQPDARYLTTYYPGVYDDAQAAPITLKAGDEVPVNLTLVPARTYRVRGTIIGITAGQQSTVELLSKSGDTFRANEIGPDGQFEVRGLAPGSYTLLASTGSGLQSLTARQDISVVAADLDGLKLAPLPAFTLSGHLHIEGNAAGATQYVVNLGINDLPEDSGFFTPQDFFGSNATVDGMGNFEWKDVHPGTYVVRVYGRSGQNNFFLKSVRIGERNIETGFTISGPATLDLLLSSKGATVEGVVVAKEKDVDNVQPVPNATVVAVPEEKYRNLSDRFAEGSTDQNGRFTIRGVAPGSYTLYAWQDLEEGVWRDPDFLRSQAENGTAVRIEEGSHKQVELKLSPTGEEWH
jgi:hypothetical protein